VWTDNVINILDAARIGSEFGSLGTSWNGDVNFDGNVNVQDLALAGGNYQKASEDVYTDWIP